MFREGLIGDVRQTRFGVPVSHFPVDPFADVVGCDRCGRHGPPELVPGCGTTYAPAGLVCDDCVIEVTTRGEWLPEWHVEFENAARDLDAEFDSLRWYAR
jgi:hypothetical protein